MLKGSIALLLGNLLCLQLWISFHPALIFLMIGVIVVLLYYRNHTLAQLFLWFIVGFIWTQITFQKALNDRLSSQYDGAVFEVMGIIDSIPQQRGRSKRFDFNVKSAQLNQQQVQLPEHIRLSSYEPRLVVRLGEMWRLRVKLKKPRGFVNPNGFDYERWLLLEGVGATGYVRGGHKAYQLIGDQASPLQKVRRGLFNHIQQYTSTTDSRGVIEALILGERFNISDEQWRLFRATGTTHLMAISGLHIGLIASFSFFLIRWLWSRSYRLTLWIAAPVAAALVSIIAAYFYAALADFSIPTQRALIMSAVVLGAVIFNRKLFSSEVLAVAAILVVLNEPMATMSVGFWLSFVAVVIIVYTSNRYPRTKRLHTLVMLQIAIFIGLAPLLLMFFGLISPLSALINLLAIPYISVLVVPLIFIGVLLSGFNDMAQMLFSLVGQLIEVFLQSLSWGADLISPILFPQIPLPLIVLALVSVVWLFAPTGWPHRWLAVIGLIPGLLFSPQRPETGEAWITILDVGQGLSVVAETKQHRLLFDTGPSYGEYFDAGEAVVIPYLHSKGYSVLDVVIVSHQDQDHMGGLSAIISDMEILKLYSPQPVSEYRGRQSECVEGVVWDWDDVRFEFLYPSINQVKAAIKSHNEQACVLKITTQWRSILLSSDIESNSEQWLISHNRDALKSDYLLVPHHGSTTSSTESFIESVQPELALVSSGYKNRFNHPDPRIVSRYRDQNIPFKTTADNGAIRVVLSHDGMVRYQRDVEHKK